MVVAGVVFVSYLLVSVLGDRACRCGAVEGRSSRAVTHGVRDLLGATLSLGLFHEQLWQVVLAVALSGTGQWTSLAALMLPHVPSGETGWAMASNQVLSLCGLRCGSAASPALMAVVGGGAAGLDVRWRSSRRSLRAV